MQKLIYLAVIKALKYQGSQGQGQDCEKQTGKLNRHSHEKLNTRKGKYLSKNKHSISTTVCSPSDNTTVGQRVISPMDWDQ